MTSKKNNDHIEPEDKKESTSVADTKASPTEVEKESTATKPESRKPERNKEKLSDKKTTAKTAQEPTPALEEKQGKRGVKLGTVAIILAILFGGGLSYKMEKDRAEYKEQISALQQQLQQTQTNLSSELKSTQAETISKANTASERAQVEIQQQQESITSLQNAITDLKGRRPNDWLLAEADYLVKLAGRKLFLEQDVVSATKLMEGADQRIASLNDPSLVSLRQLMANDITKLRTVPLIDRDGLVLRLTSLQQQVDRLPLANAILPDAVKEEKKVVSQDINDWQDNLKASLQSFSEQFITFRSRDGNVIPLLSPEQDFYLKENIKGKIETAIRATYSEQGEVYTTALNVAREWSESFLNQDDNAVKEFNKALTQLAQQKIEVSYPVKLESQHSLEDVISERLRRSVTTINSEEE
ncbi:heme biosynthesis operon protein HemX [Vibrio sp. 10N.286.49.B3]|uniref:uroporphyrinogen-III C-methyltransferase n=1 Tax=Vibrio sp. 10N.286.49.B3 TaxID=1880855 RepID=UPI000C8567BE|nr:uroporphyrinogen-III C-methyltransferase [Vibrio sp. 10N.286.49.B3]PMH45459.1 heme biosynthesis operon protein HemX [Vibrio sp. 10N.286.49.B3]